MEDVARTTYVLREVTRTVKEHEVFLSFVSDETAISFTEWLASGEGWDAFLRWLDQR